MTALPPGPSGKLFNTFQVLRDGYSFFKKGFARYGDPFLVRAMNGDVVCTKDPEAIKTIFQAPTDSFSPFGAAVLSPLLGENSLLLTHGDHHKRDRKLMTPPFHGERMRAYGDMIYNAAMEHTSKLKIGEPFRMRDLTEAITVEVILGAVFGLQSREEKDRFHHLLTDAVRSLNPAFVFMRFLQRDFFGIGPWANFKRKLGKADVELYKEFEQRRKKGSYGDDILSMLMEARYEDGEPMSDQELRDQMITLLVAGHETTATSTAWSFYHLYKEPQVRQKLHEELQSSGDISHYERARLPYLKAICDETLRFYPIVPEIMRYLQKPLTFKGYDLPAGFSVSAVMQLTHEDPQLYPEPRQFKPERFLESKYRPWEYYPFGGGNRRCLGAALAGFEMALVIATLTENFDFEVLDTTPPKNVRRNVTMGPSTGIRMRRTC
ncbi:MAG: cytochrome P450 [Myxococcales bacterium]|nr:cytochrome P450 [Myxococcales bacterium]